MTGVLLGSEWVTAPPQAESGLDVPGFAEQAIRAAREQEQAREAEQVALLRQIADHLQRLDIPTVAPAVSSPSPSLDTAGLTTAIITALAYLPAPPDSSKELAALAKSLSTLDRRVAGGALAGGPGGGVSNSILEQIRDRLPILTGTWDYHAGVSGTVVLTAGQRLLAVAAHATSAGSLTINGGDSVPIPANTGWGLDSIFAQTTAPVLVFTGTDSFTVAYLR